MTNFLTNAMKYTTQGSINLTMNYFPRAMTSEEDTHRLRCQKTVLEAAHSQLYVIKIRNPLGLVRLECADTGDGTSCPSAPVPLFSSRLLLFSSSP